MAQILSLIIGYFIGALVQTSYWYGRRRNVDIRNYGSGNAGTTNAMRTLGRKAGIITAIGDVAKVFLSALISWLIFRNMLPAMLIFLYSGLGTVVGHNFPFYMKFKGGKGVATTAGVIISLFFLPNACWVMTLIGAITFFGVLILTRYASVASLALVTEFLIEFIIWGASGNTELRGGFLAQGVCLVIIITALCYLRHIGNIERLLDGKERRFGEKPKTSRESTVQRKSQRAAKSHDETETDYYYEDELKPEDNIEPEAEAETEARVNPDTSPVTALKPDEIKKDSDTEKPNRSYIWDAEKQCYVRYKDYDRHDDE